MSVRLLFGLRWMIIRAGFQQLKESRFKVVVVVFLASLFWLGFFFAFLEGFHFLNTFEGITAIINDVLFSMFFVSLLIMLTFSNAIICFSSLYRSTEVEYLLSAPVSLSSLLFYKFTESLAFSSWAFMLLAAPFLLAYGISVGASPVFYPAIFLFSVPFIVIPGAAGALIALFLTIFFPRDRGKILGAVIVGGVVVFSVLGLTITDWHPGGNVLNIHWMQNAIGKLAFAQNPYLPSQWVVRGLIASASGKFSDAVFYFLLLAANAAFLYALLDGACSLWFRASWQKAKEAASSSKRKYSIGLFRFAGSPGDMILLKDVKTFIRDPVQWSQCAILFGILGLYILNLRNFEYHTAGPFWKNVVAFLNLAATCLTLATLTTRFVFPMISLEGQRFWILGLMPVSRWEILRTKFLFVLSGSLLITLLLVTLSNIMLGTRLEVLILQSIVSLMVCAGLAGLTVGMGVIFPNFKEADPSKIVSGFGGTFTLVLSMLYVGAMVGVVGIPCHFYFAQRSLSGSEFRLGIGLSLGFAALLTAIVCIVPLWLGRRAFDRLEL